MRRSAALAAVTALTLGLLGPTAAQAAEGPPAADSGPHDTGGAVLNIIPPGSNGSFNATEAAQANLGLQTGNPSLYPPNSVDQLQMYDALNTVPPDQIPADKLATDYYKDAPIDLPADQAVSTIHPKGGVTIQRDSHGVPFVNGASYDDVAYGAGYAGTQDRMFLQDLLRHVGAARMAEFLGPSAANIEMDREQLRIAAYTPEEAAQQITDAATKFGAEGAKLVSAVDAYIAGINAAQQAMCPAGAPTGSDCPAEYAALQTTPAPWTRADVVYVASLVGGIFGKGGGGEYANGVWLQQLQRKFGDTDGRTVFNDLRERNDPETPTTITDRFPYGSRAPGDPAAVALPDLGGQTAGGTGSDAGSNPTLPGTGLPTGAELAGQGPTGVVDGPFGKIDLGLRPHGMSNAELVDAAHSTSGHPTVVFGPQTGYFSPQLLTELSLRGPGVAARGVSFAGTNFIIELGHGVDYAWSATSASGDLVDTVMERLCNTDGSPPSVNSTGYLVGRTCVPLEHRVHQEIAKPSAGGMGTGVLIRFNVYRSRHGIVQQRTTANGGTPVAVVSQRSTYGSEPDSVIGFARIQDPGYVTDAASFERAFSGVDYTFNWFYADDRDIAYFNSGKLPLRAKGVDFDLPRFGDPRYDWTGLLDFAGHPKAINPPSGFLVSWNNKQAPGVNAADNNYGYGAIYRSLTLSDRIQGAIANGDKITRAGLVGIMMDAATVDVRGTYLLPDLLAVIGDDPAQQPAIKLLRQWLRDGAHREDRDRNGAYTDQAAIALFDEWWESQTTSPTGQFAVAKDVLRGTLGDLVDQLPQKIDDHPRQGLGSSWNDVAWYGYVDKDLRAVRGKPVRGAYSRIYCGAGSLGTCQSTLRASLSAATQRALTAQGVNSVGQLTYDKSQDFIDSVAAGVVDVPSIDWQNRPTFQQVVGFTTHRVRAEPGQQVPEAPVALLVPLLGAGLFTVVLVRRRRRLAG